MHDIDNFVGYKHNIYTEHYSGTRYSGVTTALQFPRRHLQLRVESLDLTQQSAIRPLSSRTHILRDTAK